MDIIKKKAIFFCSVLLCCLYGSKLYALPEVNTTAMTTSLTTSSQQLGNSLANGEILQLDSAVFAKALKEAIEGIAFLNANYKSLRLDEAKNKLRELSAFYASSAVTYLGSAAAIAAGLTSALGFIEYGEIRNLIRLIEAVTKLLGAYELEKLINTLKNSDLYIKSIENTHSDSIKIKLSNGKDLVINNVQIFQKLDDKNLGYEAERGLEIEEDQEESEPERAGSQEYRLMKSWDKLTVEHKNYRGKILELNIADIRALNDQNNGKDSKPTTYVIHLTQLAREGGELGIRMAISMAPYTKTAYFGTVIASTALSGAAGTCLPIMAAAGLYGVASYAKNHPDSVAGKALNKLSPYSSAIGIAAITALQLALVSYAVHEVEEVFDSVNVIYNNNETSLYSALTFPNIEVWDLTGGDPNSLLSHKGALMAPFFALLGYTASPSYFQLFVIMYYASKGAYSLAKNIRAANKTNDIKTQSIEMTNMSQNDPDPDSDREQGIIIKRHQKTPHAPPASGPSMGRNPMCQWLSNLCGWSN